MRGAHSVFSDIRERNARAARTSSPRVPQFPRSPSPRGSRATPGRRRRQPARETAPLRYLGESIGPPPLLPAQRITFPPEPGTGSSVRRARRRRTTAIRSRRRQPRYYRRRKRKPSPPTICDTRALPNGPKAAGPNRAAAERVLLVIKDRSRPTWAYAALVSASPDRAAAEHGAAIPTVHTTGPSSVQMPGQTVSFR